MSQDQPSKTKYKFIDKEKTTNYLVLAILAAVSLAVVVYVVLVKLPVFFSPEVKKVMTQEQKDAKRLEEVLKMASSAVSSPQSLSEQEQKKLEQVQALANSGAAKPKPLSDDEQKRLDEVLKMASSKNK